MEYTFDKALWTPNRKILTAENLIVPGLEVFGYSSPRDSRLALSEHIHRTTEFLVFANGFQKYRIRDTSYEIRGNQVLIVDPDCIHSTGDSPFGKNENLWFRLDLDDFAAGLGLPADARQHLRQSLIGNHGPLINIGKHWFGALQKTFFDLASPDITRQLCGYASFVGFMMELMKNAETSANCSEDIRRVLQCIRENICSPLPLEQLASSIGLTLSGFKQKFKRETGVSPREYINQRKIEHAKQLLRQGNSITDAAFSLGFNSSSYFTVVFRQFENMTPSAFIAQSRK